MGEMVLASFLKIWHVIPIVIAIILFKKFMNKKDKKRRVSQNEEHEKNGLTLELRTRKKYEASGYKVISTEMQKGENAQGIDLVCSKDDKILLFQCKNASASKSITDEDIKLFHTNALKYVEANDMEENSVEFRFVVAYADVLDKSALKILTDDSYNCKYIVL